MSLKINAEQCSTCIFGPKSPISEERLQELKQLWAAQNKHQECHQATVQNQHVGCRGHYEAARRGELSHPAILAVQEHIFNMEEIPADTCLQVGERLGLIVFVSILKEEEDA